MACQLIELPVSARELERVLHSRLDTVGGWDNASLYPHESDNTMVLEWEPHVK